MQPFCCFVIEKHKTEKYITRIKHFIIIIIITFFLGTLHLTLPFDNFIIITIIIIDGNNNKNIKRQGQMECPQEKLIFLLNLLKNKHFYFEKYCMFENFFIT